PVMPEGDCSVEFDNPQLLVKLIHEQQFPVSISVEVNGMHVIPDGNGVLRIIAELTPGQFLSCMHCSRAYIRQIILDQLYQPVGGSPDRYDSYQCTASAANQQSLVS